MQKQIYDYVVFMGRFQPFHEAHYHIVQEALQLGKEVIILVGTANSPRTIKNPWTWKEREEMIRACFNKEQNERMHFEGIEDRLYNLNLWLHFVQRSVHNITGEDKSIALIGHHKDSSSFYLDSFPQWKQIEYPNHELLNATDIRNNYLDPHMVLLNETNRNKMVEPVLNYLIDFATGDIYKDLVEEFEFIRKHKEMWDVAPYAPTFNAGDAAVFHSGHVLLIQRRAAPGKGLWALCGGYVDVDVDESTRDTAIRELIEETRIKGPNKRVLEDKVFASKVFDHRDRSLRGRIISHAYGIDLGYVGKLPKVKGSDDAEKAKWFPIEEVLHMRDQLFEDHADIINYFVGRLDK